MVVVLITIATDSAGTPFVNRHFALFYGPAVPILNRTNRHAHAGRFARLGVGRREEVARNRAAREHARLLVQQEVVREVALVTGERAAQRGRAAEVALRRLAPRPGRQ